MDSQWSSTPLGELVVNGHLHLGELVACVFLWIVNGHQPLGELVACVYG